VTWLRLRLTVCRWLGRLPLTPEENAVTGWRAAGSHIDSGPGSTQKPLSAVASPALRDDAEQHGFVEQKLICDAPRGVNPNAARVKPDCQ